MGLMPMTKTSEYRLSVNFGDNVIGILALDHATNLLKLNYSEQWQQEGFAISPSLPMNFQHTPEVAYNYLDNALPEGEVRRLLAENFGVSEKCLFTSSCYR